MYTLWLARFSLDKVLKVKVTTPSQRSNNGHTMMLHTYTPLPMSLKSINFIHITVFEIQPRQDFKVQGHYGKVKGHTMMLHTYTPYPMSLPSINFLHLTVSEIQPVQTFSRRLSAHPDTMGENNAPTALKAVG